ncbi:MAG: hypothetical protein ABW137_25785 [Mycobacterium sp.]
MSTPHALRRQDALAWLRRLARTTPGVIGAIAVAVAASCVIVGVVCAAALNDRITQHSALLERSEPFAYAAQNLYAALSAADAAAAAAYLSGVETSEMRARYQQALADSASALTDVTAGATDAATREAVADITAQLTAYAGMVEAARANNRQGFVVGSGYLREASSLMQDTTLPGAAAIYSGDLRTVGDDQRAVGSTPVVGFVLLGLVLLAIGVASVLVSGRTNRQFNLGLVVAAVSVLVVGGWMFVATRSAASAIDQSRSAATTFERLAEARTIARQARTDETLQLIARGDVTATEKSFSDRIAGLTALLEAGPPAAADGVRNWTESHRRQLTAYRNNDYNAAVAQAIGPDPQASAAQFAIVEASLRDEIERTRATLREEVAAAGAWLSWTPTGTLVLMTVAASAAVVGLWPRLKEFL